MKTASCKMYLGFVVTLFAAIAMISGCRSVTSSVSVVRVAPEHVHAQKLLSNAFRYINPAHGLIDPASGYPVEGWNQDPQRGLYLRSFTQLTTVGEWVELLACISAGQAANPYWSQEQALDELERVVKSLRADQADSGISNRGLLANFLGFDGERRMGPLTESVRKKDFVKVFGELQAEKIWNDLAARKWILSDKEGTAGRVQRATDYGRSHFDGALKLYDEQGDADAIMKLLDQRVVQIIFGDNANLTASVAKSIGALLSPSLRDNPRAAALRVLMEQFLENQRAGYTHLYDQKEGCFVFGWDAAEDRFFGWALDDGTWVVGRMNYFVNEFRGAWTFIVNRCGLPLDAVRAGTFKIKPYDLQDGRTVYVPAAWDGSAFQMLGLSLFMQEMQTPGWRPLLTNAVEAELDYSTRNGLPGFLSESYSGNGNEYTGKVGVPQFAVTSEKRITDTPSLYTLGIAYSIDPKGVEGFLTANWKTIKSLFTDHGPWEGYKTTTGSAIKFQTAVHTFSLILGFIDAGHENMARYLQNSGLPVNPTALHQVASGPEVDMLSDTFNISAWCREGNRLQQHRERDHFTMAGTGLTGLYLTLVPVESSARLDLSGRTLQLRYRSAAALPGCVLRFIPRISKGSMTMEAILNLAATGETERQLTIPLPATPALDDVKEMVLLLPDVAGDVPLNLNIGQFIASP